MSDDKKTRGRPKKERTGYNMALPPNIAMPTRKVLPETDHKGGENLTGRHSRYKPEFAEQLPALYKEHHNANGVCVALKISRPTYENWKKAYPEFKEAHEICDCIKDDILYKKLIEASLNKEINAIPLIYICKTVGQWVESKAPERDNDDRERETLEAIKHVMSKIKKEHEKDY